MQDAQTKLLDMVKGRETSEADVEKAVSSDSQSKMADDFFKEAESRAAAQKKARAMVSERFRVPVAAMTTAAGEMQAPRRIKEAESASSSSGEEADMDDFYDDLAPVAYDDDVMWGRLVRLRDDSAPRK